MGYLQEFKSQVRNTNYPGLLQLWEEYCSGEIVDGLELRDILTTIKESDLAQPFGSYVELALDLWKTIEDPQLSFSVLKLILDLETTNSEQLADITYNILVERYGEQQYFGEKIRLIGLRSRDSFQGAISNYELLTHLNKGKFVFHTGGWGTGEIIELSLVREELVLEFENVIGNKDFTFKNAFNHLVALPNEHFLSRRFGNPDKLEAEARKDPVGLLHLLLRDLGPLTAAEIKDEVCELIIPEEDWTKWWQSARARAKKDTMIETPSSVKEPFRLRTAELSHEERFKKELEESHSLDATILTIYNFVRDFSEIFKNAELREFLTRRLEDMLHSQSPSAAQKFQIYTLLENFTQESDSTRIADFIEGVKDVPALIAEIDIIAFKKRALLAVRQYRSDWPEIFLDLVFTMPQTPLRDYLLKELNKDITREQLRERLEDLLRAPSSNPETLVWYFQRVVSGDDIPLSDRANASRFFESFLVLLSRIENDPDQRELTKKMMTLISAKRWAVVRAIIQGAPIETVSEFLLLASKCQSFGDYELKTLHSLAAVEHPTLAATSRSNSDSSEDNTLWTTERGYQEAAERIKHMSQVEVVENAKEIEAARALGDLRENSEYKFALERRSRLQAEIKRLSDDLNRARIITPDDISLEETGPGNIVELESNGDVETFTLLGPWDADPDKGILSMQSKLAQAMRGKKRGESFSFQDQSYTVKNIASFLDR